jgi:hypothetical protein
MVARAAEESIGALLLFRMDRNTGRYGTPQKADALQALCDL